MSWIQKQLKKDEGFTLIELMVVVLIIAILIAIAIPTFLGARERAQDRAAQSDLRNALTAAKVFYTDEEAFDAGATGLADLALIEPSIDFDPADLAATKGSNAVLVTAGANDQEIRFSKLSVSGTAFCITEIATGGSAGTWRALEEPAAGAQDATACTAAANDADW